MGRLFGLFGKKKTNQQPTAGNLTTTSQQFTNPTPEQQVLQSLPKAIKVQQNYKDDPDVNFL